MSESEAAAAAAGRGNNDEEDCPLCLDPLPPFWDDGKRVVTTCCGKCMCKNCCDERRAYVNKAVDEGSFGRREEQLASTCALCRARIPTGDDTGRIMLDKFEKGELPLFMYCTLGGHFIGGTQGVEVNVERGMKIFRLGAERGDPNCQFVIGEKYRVGGDLPKSTAEAKEWYLAATEQGHAIAEHELAMMLGDEGDDAEYLRYIRGSAAKGYDVACYNLGLAHYGGEHGLQQSAEEAIRVVTPAAERGHAKSMGFLGAVLGAVPGYPLPPPDNPNFTKGMHWLRRAAEKGDEGAIEILSMLEEKDCSLCFRCKKKAPPQTARLRCSRCRAAWYCSKDCQRRHWKAVAGHKQFCIKWE